MSDINLQQLRQIKKIRELRATLAQGKSMAAKRLAQQKQHDFEALQDAKHTLLADQKMQLSSHQEKLRSQPTSREGLMDFMHLGREQHDQRKDMDGKILESDRARLLAQQAAEKATKQFKRAEKKRLAFEVFLQEEGHG